MRIVRFFLTSILIAIVVAVAAALVAREALLFRGKNILKSSLTTLHKLAVQKTYYDDCRKKGTAPINGEAFARLQLRFLSSTEYVVEVLCNQYSIDPLIIDQQELPFLVKKVAGQSGVVWGEQRSGVVLEVYGRQAALGVENEQIVEFSPTDALGEGPVASCTSYGFVCCRSESQQGIGQELTGASDCPKSCFSSCVSRPLVLSFNTQPPLNQETRVAEITSGTAVSFLYMLDLSQAKGVEVELDYGDGAKQKLTAAKAKVEHIYLCSQLTCNYQVKLSAVNSVGILSADLPINQLTIRVKGAR